MNQQVHAVFLITGTAIGAGLVALPLTAVNFGTGLTVAILCFAVYTAYQSSLMTLELNEITGTSATIVDLSYQLSGRKTFWVSMTSFYALSFALLTVYFSCIASTLPCFFRVNNASVVMATSLLLFGLLMCPDTLFSRLNSVLVLSFLVMIFSLVGRFISSGNTMMLPSQPTVHDALGFFPIVLTSFGVQNVCAHIYAQLKGDRRRIHKAFLVGVTLPALIYGVWIISVLGHVLAKDPSFFGQLQHHQVEVGRLIQFLCQSSGCRSMELFFQLLSLFAMVTSAIGIGLGLKNSLSERLPASSKVLPSFCVCVIPALVCLTCQETFLSILSFGAMMATLFVIFVPYYLLRKQGCKMRIGYYVCLGFGGLIVLSELVHLLRP